MKKAIALVACCLLLCSAYALADVVPNVNRELQPISGSLPVPSERTGSCTLAPAFFGTAPFDDSLTAWGITAGEVYKVYLDPELNQTEPGSCTAPFYPYQVSGVDVPLAILGDSTDIGQTICLTVDIECPEDEASPGVPRECKGPNGSVLCGVDVCHTITQEDFDAGLFTLHADLTCCVNAPFFLGVHYNGSWTGADPTAAPSVIIQFPVPAGSVCGHCYNWTYFQLQALGPETEPCWWNSCTDWTLGGTTPGPWVFSVDGSAGAACEPLTCTPCTRRHGDTAADPLQFTQGEQSITVDLCSFCSDYDQRVHDQFPGGGYTGRGGDAVVLIDFDPALQTEACFSLTLTPMCESPFTVFRVRSWLEDAIGTLWDGSPRFPTFGASQSYNVTNSGAGAIGCQPVDADFGHSFLLYIDARNCCCPVQVSYNGDTPLPVELTGFDAVAGDGQVSLVWVTGSEHNMDFFQITRNSEILTEVQATNNAAGHTYTYVDRDVENGTTYRYQLSAYDQNSAVTIFPTIESATPQSGLVNEYALSQNFPNPFNPSTAISYSVKDAGVVSLKVYSVDGREVATLVNGTQEAGKYTVSFDGGNLASGVYLYTLKVNGFSASHKMVLMK